MYAFMTVHIIATLDPNTLQIRGHISRYFSGADTLPDEPVGNGQCNGYCLENCTDSSARKSKRNQLPK